MKNHRGFTLIEVVVAAAILGMTATAIFGLLSTSLFNLRKIEDIHRYELAAQDMMSRVLLLPTLPGQSQVQGTLDKLGGRWTVHVQPWAPPNLQGSPQEAVLRVDVVVSWPGRSSERSIRVEALKVAKVAYSNYDLRGAIEAVFPQ